MNKKPIAATFIFFFIFGRYFSYRCYNKCNTMEHLQTLKITFLANLLSSRPRNLSHHLLQNVGLSAQALSSFDWSPDKARLSVSTAFDQSLRMIVCTKLGSV